MIKMLTARTTEIDETDDALKEIFEQIDIGSLEKNSVGLMHCHYEFIESGVVRALCDRLPFDVIGLTTISSATDDYYGMYGLCLTILTSDEIEFATSLTKPLSEQDYNENIADAYQKALSKLPGAPAFIISYFPYISSVSGVNLVGAFDGICGGVPIFGSICFGTDMGFENSRIIRNGEIAEDALAMLLVHGAITPEFHTISLPEINVHGNRAIVTDSEGSLLKTVNGMTITEYLDSIGFTVHKGAPLLVYYPGSSGSVAVGIYKINEDGSIVCGGNIPVGAGIAVGEVSREGVLKTAEDSIKKIIESNNKNGAFIFPCTARYFTLFPDKDDEMKIVSEKLNGKIPYMLGYSGGEICPVPNEDGTLFNRFHSFTFCSCVF